MLINTLFTWAARRWKALSPDDHSPPFTAGKRTIFCPESTANNLFPFLAALFVYSFWIEVRNWPNDWLELDPSWTYALGKMRSLGLCLGKDCWFTYGPISHWFGPPLGSERYQPLPYYFAGLFVALLLFLGLRTAFRNTRLGFTFKSGFFVLFMISLSFINYRLEAYLIIVALLLPVVGFCFERDKLWWIISLMLLSVFGIFYKFSFGLLATVCFAMALLHLFITRAVAVRWTVSIIGAYALLVPTLFLITTGGLNVIEYLKIEFEIAGNYSELLASNYTPIPFVYTIGIVHAACGLALGMTAAKDLPKNLKTSLFVTLILSLFMLYKQGHVRADYHVMCYYANLAPVFIILLMLALSAHVNLHSRKYMLLTLLSALLAVAAFLFTRIEASQNIVALSRAVLYSWETTGERFEAGFRGQSPEESATTIASLQSRHEALFALINAKCKALGAATGKKPTIAFYPWELMFAEASEACTWKPFPQLQIYSDGPESSLARRDAMWLSSKNRPDIIVIGPRSIDDNDTLSDYTTILPVLYRNYMVSSTVDDYVLLEKSSSVAPHFETIHCSDQPGNFQADFLKLTIPPEKHLHPLLWSISTVLFKAPTLTVTVSTKDHDGTTIASYSFRGYISQLQNGVYVSIDHIDKYIIRTFHRSPSFINTIGCGDDFDPSILSQYDTETAAVATRNPGTWNFPVIPEQLPLKLEFCAFR